MYVSVSQTGYTVDALLKMDGVSCPVLSHIVPYSYSQGFSLSASILLTEVDLLKIYRKLLSSLSGLFSTNSI